jgi:predicted cobalt transporter CbtA
MRATLPPRRVIKERRFRMRELTLGRTLLYAIIAGLLAGVLVLPNNPDAVTAPMELINNFRVRSIIGLTLFWAIFGATFGWLIQRAMQRTTARSVAALG